MRITIDQTAFDALSADVQTLYKKDGDAYKLSIPGMVAEADVGSLKRAKDRVAEEKRELQARLNEMETKLADIDGMDAKKTGDIEKLTRAHEAKLAKLTQDHQAALKVRDDFIRKSLVDSVADQLSREISTTPVAMKAYLQGRLKANLDNNEFSTQVLDMDGNVTDASLEDLKKEVLQNKEFSGILIASKANGGSTTGQTAQDRSTILSRAKEESFDFSKLSVKDKVEYLKAKTGTNNGA